MSQLYKLLPGGLLIAVSVLSTNLSRQSQSKSDPLKPYTTCELPGDLKVKEVTRRSKGDNYRYVKTAKGNEKVSVVDGYRVMIAYSDLVYFFANVKIEESDPTRYLEDKEKVINEQKYYSSTKQATEMIFTDKTMLNGFEHYGIDRDKIDVGGQVGIHLLLYDPDNLIITVYILNQDDKNLPKSMLGQRHFHNIDEYRTLKDDFLNHYSACLKRVADEQH
jgi:hypothetical protein